MAAIPKRFYTGQPGTAAGIFYTAPASTKAIVKNIVLTNTTSLDAIIDVYFVPSGGTPGPANVIIASHRVQANDTVVVGLSSVLEAGDSIRAKQTTASAITSHISGVEIT